MFYSGHLTRGSSKTGISGLTLGYSLSRKKNIPLNIPFKITWKNGQTAQKFWRNIVLLFNIISVDNTNIPLIFWLPLVPRKWPEVYRPPRGHEVTKHRFTVRSVCVCTCALYTHPAHTYHLFSGLGKITLASNIFIRYSHKEQLPPAISISLKPSPAITIQHKSSSQRYYRQLCNCSPLL